MKIKAIGRNLLIRTNFDLIDAVQEKTVIALPKETTDKLMGGCQIHTILSMGASAFDDAAISEQEMDWVGRQVVTSRYPGHAIDYDPLASDAAVAAVRMISCDEVHAILDEDGADV